MCARQQWWEGLYRSSGRGKSARRPRRAKEKSVKVSSSVTAPPIIITYLEYERVRLVDIVALVEPPLRVKREGVGPPQVGATLHVDERVAYLS